MTPEPTSPRSSAPAPEDIEELTGGVNTVVRIGNRVHRPAAPWNGPVHALLRHLADQGYDGAPRVHGFDDLGREVLDFLPGRIVEDPHELSIDAVASVGRLLRGYHDATVSFVPTAPTGWQLPSRSPLEVICHGDAAWYNTVFTGDHATGFIDFDTAHPGPRSWDLAYALYRFAQLTDPTGPEGRTIASEQATRARTLLDAYGADRALRADAVGQIIPRLTALVDFMTERADAGDAAFAGHLAAGHGDLYRQDISYIGAHRAVWDREIIGA